MQTLQHMVTDNTIDVLLFDQPIVQGGSPMVSMESGNHVRLLEQDF